MSEILLCNQSLNSSFLQNQCGINIDQISAFSCTKPTMATAYTPYLISSDHSGTSRGILGQLSHVPVAKELTNLSLSYGGDNTMAIAEISARLRDYNIGMMGASTSFYANRIGGFAGSVKDYQQSLMEYRHAVEAKSPMKAVMKQKAYAAFQKMQTQFQHELRAVTFKNNARRGTPLTSADRATNIANSSRNVAKLNVTDHIQASNLVKFSRYTKFLGNGLAVIDFGSRVGNIHNSYQAGGKWERDMFIESSSFALSAGSGVLAIDAGAGVLGFLMVATPIGWVGLVVGGLAVAGTAAGISSVVNSAIKENSGSWYDALMSALGVKHEPIFTAASFYLLFYVSMR